MLEELRWKLATKLMEAAHNQIIKGSFRNIKRGLKLIKVAIMVMPYDEAGLAYLRASWSTWVTDMRES